MRTLDLTGQIFGDFKAIEITEPVVNYGGKWWKCVCVNCGDISSVYGGSLSSHRGCNCKKCKKTYGGITSLSRRFDIIKSVALGSNYSTLNYNGVGIVDSWRYDKKAFIKWAVDNGANDTMIICYVGAGKPVGPDTMAVRSISERNRSKSDVNLITYNGESHNLIEWGTILNIQSNVISNRLHRYKWTIPEALFTKPRQKIGTPIYDHKGNFVCNKI